MIYLCQWQTRRAIKTLVVASGKAGGKMRKFHTTGFTLIELVVVITIAAILMAIILPVFSGIARSSNQQTCINNLRNIGTMLAQYRQDHGAYPPAPQAGYLRTLDPQSLPYSDYPFGIPRITPTVKGALDNDFTVGGYYAGDKILHYKVVIDGTDSFKWSANGGITWNGLLVAITAGVAQPLNNGVTITFRSTTGYVKDDFGTFSVGPDISFTCNDDRSAHSNPDDCTVSTVTGTTRGNTVAHYIVQIDSVGATDTYKWSLDGGITWSGYGVAIVAGKAQPLGSGVLVEFTASTDRKVGDSWAFSAGPIYTDQPGGKEAQPTTLTAQALTGATTVQVNSIAGLKLGMHVLLHDYDPYSNNVDAVVIDAKPTGNTVSFSPALKHDYKSDPAHADLIGTLDPRVRNFGLATLYYQNMNEDKNAEIRQSTTDRSGIMRAQGPMSFHCPQMTDTESVNLQSNINALAVDGEYRKFDPLWAGYNTYDVTYNYDQFVTGIRDFDAAMNLGNLNSGRQLQNPAAPADTVVCWCYGHKPVQAATIAGVNATVPDLTVDLNQLSLPTTEPERTRAINAGIADKVRAAEHGRRTDHDLVLFVDGSVQVMTPSLVRRKDDYNGNPAYYWVPPFLYSPGDWRK